MRETRGGLGTWVGFLSREDGNQEIFHASFIYSAYLALCGQNTVEVMDVLHWINAPASRVDNHRQL